MARLDDLRTKRDDLIDLLASLTSRLETSEGDSRKVVEYDLGQAKTALATIDREIAKLELAAGTAGSIRQVRINTRKGW